eukprot:5313169-Pyramimonas_sp.AAC.1
MIDDVWPWLQQKGVRLTKIHPLHRDEASEESKKLVQSNKDEGDRAKASASAPEQAPAVKPPGTPLSNDAENFPSLGQSAPRTGRAFKPPPGKAVAEAWPPLPKIDAPGK